MNGKNKYQIDPNVCGPKKGFNGIIQFTRFPMMWATQALDWLDFQRVAHCPEGPPHEWIGWQINIKVGPMDGSMGPCTSARPP